MGASLQNEKPYVANTLLAGVINTIDETASIIRCKTGCGSRSCGASFTGQRRSKGTEGKDDALPLFNSVTKTLLAMGYQLRYAGSEIAGTREAI